MGTYDWIKEQYPGNVPVSVAAKVMHKPAGYVQLGLENGTLRFGSCVRNERCAFHIAPEAFIKYMEGADMLDIRSLLDDLAQSTAKATAKEIIENNRRCNNAGY